jgi:glutamate synthase (ferredoxin)
MRLLSLCGLLAATSGLRIHVSPLRRGGRHQLAGPLSCGPAGRFRPRSRSQCRDTRCAAANAAASSLSISMGSSGGSFKGWPEPGPSWLVDERDGCGVGFIANPSGVCNHNALALGLKALGCMEHRGACLSDGVSGDGSGVMTSIPWKLLERDLGAEGLPPRESRGVGMVFFPRDAKKRARCEAVIEEEVAKFKLEFHGWRDVPVDTHPLGHQARANQPVIRQLVVSSGASGREGDELERALYLLRRTAAQRLIDEGLDWHEDMYFCSLSSRTIVYKGMTNAASLGEFYMDLRDFMYETSFVVYHRRFSTNTMPKWPLAQPMRMLGHNGEINTLLGNINWVKARERELGEQCDINKMDDLKSFISGCDIQDDGAFEPLVDNRKSDSANLDSTFELLVQSGADAEESLMIMVPEAYKSQPELEARPEVTAFYEFWEGHQEAWDGPALLVWSDGKKVGACLDRNGLRPARYLQTRDGMVCMMSETGVVPLDESQIVKKGRLGPGQMIAVDLTSGRFEGNWDIKTRVAGARPYGQWLRDHQVVVPHLPFKNGRFFEDVELIRQQTAFGWSSEDVDMQLADMASSGKETTFSMGDDIPLAVLSERPHVLYDYFKQRFAQVTNPPIDPLREGMVMSLGVALGKKGNIMSPQPDFARQVRLQDPVLNRAEIDLLTRGPLPSETLTLHYPLSDGPDGLERAVKALTDAAMEAVSRGVEVLILSDLENAGGERVGILPETAYIPPLLATGAVHHRLIKEGLRMDASIIVQTAQAWSTHHFACLVGFGASAVHPYLALDSVRGWHSSKRVQQLMKTGKLPSVTPLEAQQNFRKSICAGLLKIMSKMGISLLSSYQGAQIFEAIGIGEDLLNLGFAGTPSRLGGLTIRNLADETVQFTEAAYGGERTKLENYGYVQFYRSGEYHHNSPILMKSLHKAIRDREYDLYELYRQSVESRPITALRDLLTIKSDREPIPLSEVESAEAIMARFCTGGMSLGALSREAHETLAIGVNRVGGKSNSGEGGEDPARFTPIMDVDEMGDSPSFPHLKGLKSGDNAGSAIKQVASGRFGVTPEFLMSGKQLEIKIAQGAKPGEGGQLPGPKIDNYIAGLRASTPGVTLISPPPHHDIYSIEDLAQLIHDLHQINPRAGVSVKLVSEVGIGTVAAGVAKANADVIQISGHDGGTGASPLSSIKHAGSPWELGLAEVHRTLLENSLRDRSLLRVDGGLKTGWDVMMGALMGAEEFGFGTIAMVAEGCIMARICHTNGCPVGVTTQKEELRKKFPGTPDNVAIFFQFVAEEVRLLLAGLGYRSIEDLIGRADLLEAREGLHLRKSAPLDLRFLMDLPNVSEATERSWLHHGDVRSNGPVLDDDILAEHAVQEAIARGHQLDIVRDIVNTDRSTGARISGAIASQWGNVGFANAGGVLRLQFTGSAGQSFGAFTLPGMDITLTGEANDYVGKGINGGRIVIKPLPDAQFDPSESTICGNTCLYGATGGELYAYGKAGERFGVRNSAARAVVEGFGDHGCEYMTGGIIVSLGSVGRNLGAGMTGGIAYVLDEENSDAFLQRVNPETVKVQRIITEQGSTQLKQMVAEHARLTGSVKAKILLEDWASSVKRFWQIYPASEANSPITNPASAGSSGAVGASGEGARLLPSAKAPRTD